MKTIVLYKSKSGFVKKYAQWIAEDLSADLYEASNVSIDNLLGYDVIVYGGGLYASGINGFKFITGNVDKLKDKKLIAFACGAVAPREDAMKEIYTQNFTEEQGKHIKFFYLRGGFDFNKLTFTDKVLMKLLEWKIKFKKKRGQELNGDEIGMLKAYEKPADFTKRDNIKELVAYAKGE